MATSFDAKQAANVIREMETFEEGLRQRTEGITWMIWGLVLAGLVVSFHAGELMRVDLPDPDKPRPWTLFFPWLPWALGGGLATAAVWRSASLHAPGVARPWWVSALALALVPIGMVILFIASWALPAEAQRLFTPATLLGLAGLFVVLSPLPRLTKAGRRAGVFATSAQLVGGVIMGIVAPPQDAMFITTSFLLGGTWLAAGLWETTRG